MAHVLIKSSIHRCQAEAHFFFPNAQGKHFCSHVILEPHPWKIATSGALDQDLIHSTKISFYPKIYFVVINSLVVLSVQPDSTHKYTIGGSSNSITLDIIFVHGSLGSITGSSNFFSIVTIIIYFEVSQKYLVYSNRKPSASNE